MGLGIEFHAVVVQPSEHRIPALRQLRQLRILDIEMALTHGAAHMHDRVAGHATQTILALGRVLDFAYGMLLHGAGEDERVIVAAPAP